MEDYQKWISFKQFLNKFNAELPDINVFKLYLIYSLNLGGFDKFIKNINNKYMNDKKIKKYQKIIDLSNNINYFSNHLVITAYKSKKNMFF